MKIVITGTSAGIGRELARRFAVGGHEVIGLSRREKDTLAGNFRGIMCDVADRAQVRAVIRNIGDVDALICAAAEQGPMGSFVTADPEEWLTSVQRNLAATVLPLREFFPHLRKANGRAKVICFSGGGGTQGRAHFSAYGSAKTALLRLVETLALEWKDTAVDINAIAPGALPTEMTRRIVEAGPERVGEAEHAKAVKLVGDGGDFAKVTALVGFLLGTDSDGIGGRLFSAPWDDWAQWKGRAGELAKTDWFQLRRVLPPPSEGGP